MELTNRTILITGGASGIGFALAKQLVGNGNKVIVCGRSQDKLNKVKEHLPALETIRCDINKPHDLNELVSLLAGRYPQLDTLIN
ncbi:MAG: SDR family NAD(P)-dependent oxidoreductase, partial [Gammaproteobacteria bacterium]|nr:SDR family NAD(P)-dependent oxidoreductase [Gammaproteobacteria bacterium]